MNCRNFQDRIEDYLQGGLDFAGRFAIERHARQCIDCGKEMADAQKLSQMVRQLDRVKAPPDFESVLLKRIGQRRIARRRRRFRLDWIYGFGVFSWHKAAAAATVVLAFAVGITLFRYLRPRDRETISPAAIVEVQRGKNNSPGNTDNPLDAETAISAGAVEPEVADGTIPMEISSQQTQGGILSVGKNSHIFAEPVGTEYVEYLVPVPGDRRMIMRLPKTIRMQYAPPSEEYFIRNVSH